MLCSERHPNFYALLQFSLSHIVKRVVIFNLCINSLLASVCMCPVCVVIACRSQKPASDPLELEIKTAVSHHVGARNWCWVLRSENAPNH